MDLYKYEVVVENRTVQLLIFAGYVRYEELKKIPELIEKYNIDPGRPVLTAGKRPSWYAEGFAAYLAEMGVPFIADYRPIMGKFMVIYSRSDEAIEPGEIIEIPRKYVVRIESIEAMDRKRLAEKQKSRGDQQ